MKSDGKAKRILVGLTLAICASALGGCATMPGGVPKSVRVALPAAPSFMSAYAEPDIQVGMDAKVAFGRERTALRGANARLEASRSWYLGVRQRYGG